MRDVQLNLEYEHTHRGSRCSKVGSFRLAVTSTKAEAFAKAVAEVERMAEWILERSSNMKTVITITIDDEPSQ